MEQESQEVFDALSVGIPETLGKRLLGLYAYGSLVLGDFDDRLSDIDLLAVTDGPISDEELVTLTIFHDDLAESHPLWVDRVEVGYFPASVLKRYEDGGEVVRISPGEPLHRTGFLPHWLVDLYAVQEEGRRVAGPEASVFIPRISADDFRTTVQRGVESWLDWMVGAYPERTQAYIRLTMCRSLYSYETAKQTSKIAAAEWVIKTYPQWTKIVEDGLRWRQEDSDKANEPAYVDTEAFVNFAYERTR